MSLSSLIEPHNLPTGVSVSVQQAAVATQPSAFLSPETLSSPVHLPPNATEGEKLGAAIQSALQNDDFENADAMIGNLLEFFPDQPDMLRLQAISYDKQMRFSESEPVYARIMKLNPRQDDVFYRDYARTLSQLARFEEAIELCEVSKRRSPTNADARYIIARCLYCLGRHERSLYYYEQAARLWPEHPHAQYSLGQMRLLLSDLREGYEGYEYRFEVSNMARPRFSCPRWQGESLRGKRLLIWVEQGTGDIVMFSGFLPYLLAQQPAEVEMVMYPVLLPVLERSFPEIRFMPYRQRGDVIVTSGAHFDYHMPIADVLLRCLPHYIPAREHGAYLQADPEKIATYRQWQQSLGPGRHVGVAWFSTNDRNGIVRNTKLEQWLPIFSAEGCHFISLQHGEAGKDIDRLYESHGIKVHRPPFDVMQANDDLIALIAGLDEVISIQQTAVHMAGALGTPTTLMLSKASDFRWRLNTTDNYWYRNVTIERQAEAMQWAPVIERVAASLRQRASREAKAA